MQPINEVMKINSKTSFVRLFYAGNAVSAIESAQSPNCFTIRNTNFDALPLSNSTSASFTSHKFDYSSVKSVEVVENINSQSDKPDLSTARVVISGGKAFKSAENFAILDKLAAKIPNCAVGASRAAVDAEYCSNDLQIGQTGKTVAPELYMAFGISGAIQHVAGMKDSKVIVAINTDKEAPIFEHCTYGLVGDVFKVVPELTDKL